MIIMKKIFAVYNKIEEYLLVGSLVFTTTLIFIQVVMRYVFNSSITWSEELARYIFIWQGWMGTSLGIRMKGHIRIEIITTKLELTGRKILDVLVATILLAFSIFLIVSGSDLVLKIASRKALSSALRIPLHYIFMALPVSSGVTSLRLIDQIFDILKSFKRSKGEVV